jgi:hypothetical protein
MTNDVAKFFGNSLPATEQLVEQLKVFAAGRQMLAGKALLRLTKAGQWVFGMGNTPLDNDIRLIVNPASMSSGYVAWHAGAVEAEVMQPIAQGPVPSDKLRAVKAKKGWESQVSVELMTQTDPPVHLIYKSSSLGGQDVFFGLAGDVAFGLTQDPARVYPVIELQKSSYQHKEYGEVFKPVFLVSYWLDADGKSIPLKPKLARGKAGLL